MENQNSSVGARFIAPDEEILTGRINAAPTDTFSMVSNWDLLGSIGNWDLSLAWGG